MCTYMSVYANIKYVTFNFLHNISYGKVYFCEKIYMKYYSPCFSNLKKLFNIFNIFFNYVNT